MPPNSSVDISQIVADSQRHQDVVTATNETLDKVDADHAANIENQVGAINDEGRLQAAAELIKNSMKVAHEKQNAESAAAFGTNMEAANSVVAEFSGLILKQHGELQKAGQEILKKQETSFADDPIAALVNSFTLPKDVAAYNTREQILERNVKTLAELQNLTQEQVKVNNAIAASTSAELGRVEADRLLAAAAQRAAQAKQEADRFNLQSVSVRTATSKSQFETVLQVHQANVALQHLQLQERSTAVSEEMKDLQKKNLQLLIDKRDEDAQAKAEFQAQLDKATALTGMRRVTTQEWDRMPAKQKEALFDVMSNPNSNEGRLGSNTVDALNNAEKLNMPLTPALQQTKEALNRVTADTIGKHAEWSTLKTDQQAAILQKAIRDRVLGEITNIPDTGGFYSAPPLQSLKGIPAITNTTLWKSVLAPQANNKMAPTSAQRIYDSAIALVLDKKMPIEQAAQEISTIYKAITVDNTANRDYNRFALPMQPTYKTSINPGITGLPFGNHVVVDMSNEGAVLNQMMRSLAAQKAGVYREAARPSGNL